MTADTRTLPELEDQVRTLEINLTVEERCFAELEANHKKEMELLTGACASAKKPDASIGRPRSARWSRSGTSTRSSKNKANAAWHIWECFLAR